MIDTPDLRACPFCGKDCEPMIDATRILGLWRIVHRCSVIGPISLERSDAKRLADLWNTRSDLTAAAIRAGDGA